MATENQSQTSETSSRTGSTQCADEASSARDSLNSLLDKSIDIGNVECSLANQCSIACKDLKNEQRKIVRCSTTGQWVWSVLFIFISVGGLLYTPLDFMLWEKLNMRPGFPPYDWWADPPDEVRLRVYVFNVTNHVRFLKGIDTKLNVEEIGPIVYLEKLIHTKMRFNDNSTFTYTANRTAIYLPDENTVDLNATLYVPNLALLGLSSYLYNSPYFVRIGFQILANSLSSEFIVKKTVYEYLWEYREPLLDASKAAVPGMVPVDNMGLLTRVYADFIDEVTVTVGPRWGDERFFQIHRFRGEPQLPGYDPDQCPDRIFGSTEGVMYRQRLTKQDVLLYWRKTVCKLMPLYFDSELVVDNVPVYRYNLSESVFERITNGTDCYNTHPPLPSGISDASKCYFNFPMVVSYPHFYTGGPAPDQFVTGLAPDRYKHNSYVVVEPLTGTPFRSVARMQSNLRIHDLSGFSAEYDKFSHLILPLFWAEYNQEGLPKHIKNTIYFMTVILPPLSTATFTAILLLGLFIILRQIYIQVYKDNSLNSALHSRCNQNKALANSKWFTHEKESLVK